jgi:hypothetical protein
MNFEESSEFIAIVLFHQPITSRPFCRERSEDLCVKSVERWLQTAQVTEWRCSEWCGLLSMASLTTAIFLGVHTVFTLPPFFYSVEPVASKFQTQVDGMG